MTISGMPEKSSSSGYGNQGVFSRVTSKWGTKTLVALKDGELRFSELKKQLDNITDRMLIKTLQELESDGFIMRNFSGTGSKKVFYNLSPAGHELAVLLKTLTFWINSYIQTHPKADVK